MRGALTPHMRRVSGTMGSSPRMRGALVVGAVSERHAGIIPAYAGSTDSARIPSPARQDHPRVCGEHLAALGDSVSLMGSSPRMRGARKRLLRAGRGAGIIPAYAGSTCPCARCAIRRQDHPRVCGEHPTTGLTTCTTAGSSPRMRGALFVPPLPPWLDRIIPAYAGSTFTAR